LLSQTRYRCSRGVDDRTDCIMKAKRIVTMAAGVTVLALLSLNAFVSPMRKETPKTDDRGHVLVDLWAKYQKACYKDLPQDAADAAEEIIEAAKAQHLPWDFYEGWEAYREQRISMNWKERESLDNRFSEAVADFDEPIVTFHYKDGHGKWGRNEAWEWVSGEKERLQGSCNRQFLEHGSVAWMMGNCLPKYLTSDWEYTLWALLQGRGDGAHGYEGDEVYDSLMEIAGGSYPRSAYLEYLSASKLSDKETRMAALEEVEKKYHGRAVGCYAGADLLTKKFASLRNAGAKSADYKAFYAECKEFEALRKSLSGAEAAMVKDTKSVEELIEELSWQNLQVSVEDGKATVSFRNVSSATFAVKQRGGKVVMSKTIANPAGSFYATDTVAVELPALDDGDYEMSAKKGKVEGAASWSRHTLSVATRTADGHVGIYVADHRTGEPIHSADLTLKRRGKLVATEQGFSMGDGFTNLPASFEAIMQNDHSGYYELVASLREGGLLRCSEAHNFRGDFVGFGSESAPGFYSNLLTDRGAYNPGDTMYYKVILYTGNLRDEVSVCPAGQEVKVSLLDADRNVIGVEELTTGEFGSVSGSFAIPSEVKGGWFRLSLEGGKYRGGKSVRVDEFVLPTFDLSFYEDDRLWLPGDTVEVKGRLSSYSGHPLSGARLSYVAKTAMTVLGEGVLHPSSDGSFVITFPTDTLSRWGECTLVVKVMDETGETQEFSKWMVVSGKIRVSATVDGIDAQGEGDRWSGDVTYVSGDTVAVEFTTRDRRGVQVSVPVKYEIKDESGAVLFGGTAESGESKSFAMGGRQGKFTMAVEAECSRDGRRGAKDSDTITFYRIEDDATSLDAPLDYYFRCMGTDLEAGEAIRLKLGSASGPLWAVLEVYGKDGDVLERRLVHLLGGRGKEGSMADISIDYAQSWPDAVAVQLFWFRNSSSQTVSRGFRRVRRSLDLPLSFDSFLDMTIPGHRYNVSLSSAAGAEAAVSIFDKATERICSNEWRKVSARQELANVPGIAGTCGSIDTDYGCQDAYLKERVMLASEARYGEINLLATDDMVEAVEEDADAGSGEEQAAVREDFAKTLYWNPSLRSADDGSLSFDFETSGKLSTFLVQIYAHDKSMHNAVVRREMTVTLPVKVAVAEPQYLYVGDSPALAVSVSSMADEDVSGTLVLECYDGKEYKGLKPVRSLSVPMTVEAGGSAAHSFELGTMEKAGDLGLKVAFKSDGFSDAMFVTVQVRPAVQILTEAHSAVILAGDDEAAIVESLRGEFVNTSPAGATHKVITVLDMVREALPSKVEPCHDDVLSLSEAFYVRLVAESLGASIDYAMPSDELYGKIMDCRNEDGGFAWYSGMPSSPVITAVMLERLSKLSAAGLLQQYDSDIDLTSAVKYLDDIYFALGFPYWCGGVSFSQYLHVRSLYPEVAFAPAQRAGTESEKSFAKRMKEFRKDVKEYLVPSKERGLNGEVFAKTRRLSTLWHLSESDEGIALAKSWGVSLGAADKLRSSLEADVASLLQYAVEHKDGGVYYPNLVMPFRGLLESEAYAHSMLCSLFSDYGKGEGRKSSEQAEAVADGIRLWLMLQKETQKWDDDPAFVDAIASVMAASDEVKATRVVSLSKTYEKPFAEIQAAGSGFTISRRFMREVSVPDIENPGGKKAVSEEVKPGEKVRRGDKITAVYEIWNGENRSFVRLTAPREAALRPVDQLSGYYVSWRPTALRVNGWYSFTPSGYREVGASETVFSFDTYPEEKTTVSEEFFVTQDGTFSAPVVSIESLYAPHYRANGAASEPLNILPEGR